MILGTRVRGVRNALIALLVLGGTVAAVHAAPLQTAVSPQVALVPAAAPSLTSAMAIGGLSLFGLLALRRRVRGYQP